MSDEATEMIAMMKAHIKKNDTDHRVFFKQMKSTDEAIRGNGKQGLRSIVEGQDHRISVVEGVVDEIKKMRQWFMYGALGIITMAILQLLGWAGSVK